jgi:hypothetical protein
MPIDFFTAPCAKTDCHCKSPGVVCGKTTMNMEFGLCDDPPPAEFPAYIQEYRPDDWIARVENPHSKPITFKAIDNCVDLLRSDGDLENRCDGVLLLQNKLTFVELKDRISDGWLAKAMDQLISTIAGFVNNHDKSKFELTEAYVCNKQRPYAITSIRNEMQQFKQATSDLLDNNGLLLVVNKVVRFD